MYISTSLCLPLRHLILPAFTLVGNKKNYISKLETWVSVSGLWNIMFSVFLIFNGWDSAAALKHGTKQGLQIESILIKSVLVHWPYDLYIIFKNSHVFIFEDLLVINGRWSVFNQLASVLNSYFLASKIHKLCHYETLTLWAYY